MSCSFRNGLQRITNSHHGCQLLVSGLSNNPYKLFLGLYGLWSFLGGYLSRASKDTNSEGNHAFQTSSSRSFMGRFKKGRDKKEYPVGEKFTTAEWQVSTGTSLNPGACFCFLMHQSCLAKTRKYSLELPSPTHMSEHGKPVKTPIRTYTTASFQSVRTR